VYNYKAGEQCQKCGGNFGSQQKKTEEAAHAQGHQPGQQKEGDEGVPGGEGDVGTLPGALKFLVELFPELAEQHDLEKKFRDKMAAKKEAEEKKERDKKPQKKQLGEASNELRLAEDARRKVGRELQAEKDKKKEQIKKVDMEKKKLEDIENNIGELEKRGVQSDELVEEKMAAYKLVQKQAEEVPDSHEGGVKEEGGGVPEVVMEVPKDDEVPPNGKGGKPSNEGKPGGSKGPGDGKGVKEAGRGDTRNRTRSPRGRGGKGADIPANAEEEQSLSEEAKRLLEQYKQQVQKDKDKRKEREEEEERKAEDKRRRLEEEGKTLTGASVADDQAALDLAAAQAKKDAEERLRSAA